MAVYNRDYCFNSLGFFSTIVIQVKLKLCSVSSYRVSSRNKSHNSAQPSTSLEASRRRPPACSHQAGPRRAGSRAKILAPFKGHWSKSQGIGLKVNSTRQPCLYGVKRGVNAEYKSYVQKPHVEANGIKSRVPASWESPFCVKIEQKSIHFNYSSHCLECRKVRLSFSFWLRGHAFNRTVKNCYVGSYWSQLSLIINIPD